MVYFANFIMDENKENPSSDDMIDIQIEESLVKESLMVIDSANFKKDMMVLLGFLAIFALSFAYGLLGPPAKVAKDEMFNITKPIFNRKYVGISTLNRFISFSVYLKTPNSKQCKKMSINMKLDCYKENRIVHTFNGNFRKNPVCPEKYMYNYKFFEEKIIDFDKVEINVGINGLSDIYKNGAILFEYGNEDYTLFQIYIRIVFSLIEFIFLILLYLKLRNLPVKLWHLEQKITVPFLFLSFLFSNPLYPIQAFYPSNLYIVFETIMNSLFKTYFKFFVLVLFDSLRYKNRKTNIMFYIPKVLFLLIYFFVNIIHGIYDIVLLSSNSTSDISGKGFHEVIGNLEWALFIIYIIWALIIFIISFRNVDITEKNKFYIYAFINGITSLILFAVNNYVFLKNSNMNVDDNTMSFILSFIVQNVYVLLNAYFHWPFDTLQDTYNNDDDNKPTTVEPNEFFADEKNN